MFYVITFKKGISFREKVYNKQIIYTVPWSDALHHVSWIFLDLTHHPWCSASRVILWSGDIYSPWCNVSNKVTAVIMDIYRTYQIRKSYQNTTIVIWSNSNPVRWRYIFSYGFRKQGCTKRSHGQSLQPHIYTCQGKKAVMCKLRTWTRLFKTNDVVS